MLWILGAIVVGLISGFIARAIVPGDDSMGIGGTIVLGLVGSLVGGFIGYLIFHKRQRQRGLPDVGIPRQHRRFVLVLLAWRVQQSHRGPLTRPDRIGACRSTAT